MNPDKLLYIFHKELANINHKTTSYQMAVQIAEQKKKELNQKYQNEAEKLFEKGKI